jgi:alkanesulfonate monooxygenase SsuD/methylene tetrahydromethanopterin reductase-like flavin-dependent oxidoreductase (luciferase family)
MQAIWTHDEPSYEGEFVKFGPMSQWPKPFQKPYPPIIVGGAYPFAAKRAIAYGNGWIPRADRLEHDGIGVIIKQFRDMATEAGRDPVSLPITIFRVPDDLAQLRFCMEIGIDRVVFSLPAATEDAILPILDRWVEVKRDLGI